MLFETSKLSFKILIAGSLEDEIKQEVLELVNSDKQVNYLGFVTGEYLTNLLCACDMYLQQGTISQTSQVAIAAVHQLCLCAALQMMNYLKKIVFY